MLGVATSLIYMACPHLPHDNVAIVKCRLRWRACIAETMPGLQAHLSAFLQDPPASPPGCQLKEVLSRWDHLLRVCLSFVEFIKLLDLKTWLACERIKYSSQLQLPVLLTTHVCRHSKHAVLPMPEACQAGLRQPRHATAHTPMLSKPSTRATGKGRSLPITGCLQTSLKVPTAAMLHPHSGQHILRPLQCRMTPGQMPCDISKLALWTCIWLTDQHPGRPCSCALRPARCKVSMLTGMPCALQQQRQRGLQVAAALRERGGRALAREAHGLQLRERGRVRHGQRRRRRRRPRARCARPGPQAPDTAAPLPP